MLMLMLRQSLMRNRKRKLLAIATIALAATLITTLASLLINVGDRMAHELKTYGANIHVIPRSAALAPDIGGVEDNPLRDQDLLAEQELPRIKDIFWANNIVGFAPFLETRVRLLRPGGPQVPMVGTYFNKALALPDEPGYRTGIRATNPSWSVRGGWPDDARPAEVLVGAGLARRLALLPGQRLRVVGDGAAAREAMLAVTGVLSTGGREEQAIIAPLALAQRLAGQPGRVQSVSVSALTVPENELSRRARREPNALTAEEYERWYCTAYVSSVAYQLEEALGDATARPVWQVAASEGVVIGKIQLLVLVVTLAALLSSAMAIVSLMNTAVLERSVEIGLMKALGAARGEVVAQFLTEAAVLGFIGGAIGVVFGFAFSQLVGATLFGSMLGLPWVVPPLIAVVSILIALLGSAWPCRRIAGLLPAEVLYGRR